MEVENLAEDIIAFELQREPLMTGELKTISDIAEDRRDCDVVLDFLKVDIITSPSLAKLLKMRQTLRDAGHRLILCSVHPFTRSAFMITGLDGFFECAEDKEEALSLLQTDWFPNDSV
jgi:anti-anti-sigma factor